MEGCFNLEDVPGRAEYESACLIGIGDALCKIRNEMNNYYRYSQLSSCGHAGNSQKAAEFPSYFRLLLANKNTNSRSRWELHYVEAICG